MAVTAPPYSTSLPEATPSRWERLRTHLQRLRRWLRPPRQFRPTRAGLGFMFLSLSVGFAALNTGNNLLYMVLGMMLSLIGVSGVLSELSVQRMSITRRLPLEVTAGRDAFISLVVANHKRILPSVGIWLEDAGVAGLDVDPCFVVYVAPSGEAVHRCRYRFARRGLHELPRVEVSTTYPFGLFRRSYQFHQLDQVLVFPPIEPVAPRRNAHEAREGDIATRRRGDGEEFYGLRIYAPGDDPRRIHWKHSARRSRLLLRENTALQRERVVVAMEISHPLPEEEAYEDALLRVVSYSAHYLEKGYSVAVDIPGGATPFESGVVQLRRILRLIALAPRAGEAAELPASSVAWPRVGRVLVRVTGQLVQVEETT